MKNYLFYIAVVILVVSCRALSIPTNQPLDRIVLVSGDTLYGKVDYFKEGYAYSEFYRKIRVTDTKGRKRRFKPDKVVSYRVNGSDYESFLLDQDTKLFRDGRFLDSRYLIDPNGTQYFLKVKSKGKLAHYELEWIDFDNNDLESTALIKKAGDNFFIPAENGLSRVLKKVVSEYLADCPLIQKKIINKEFKYVFQVVDFYNENCGQQ